MLNILDDYELEEAIREVAENSDVKTDGIGKVDDEDGMFSIVVVDEYGDADIIDVEINELLDHLIAVDVFEYEMTCAYCKGLI